MFRWNHFGYSNFPYYINWNCFSSHVKPKIVDKTADNNSDSYNNYNNYFSPIHEKSMLMLFLILSIHLFALVCYGIDNLSLKLLKEIKKLTNKTKI